MEFGICYFNEEHKKILAKCDILPNGKLGAMVLDWQAWFCWG